MQDPVTQQLLAQFMRFVEQSNQRYDNLARLITDREPNLDRPFPGSGWPRQQLEGVIKFPELVVQPFLWGYEELTEGGIAGGPSYATTAGVAECNLQVNDIKSFVQGIAFRLRRTAAPDGSVLPVGAWLPFGCKYHPFANSGDVYVGKDFEWSAQSNDDGLLFQGSNGTSTRASNDLNVDGVFWLRQEYQCRPRDTFNIRATPLVDPVEGDTYRLEAALVGYKMIFDTRK